MDGLILSVHPTGDGVGDGLGVVGGVGVIHAHANPTSAQNVPDGQFGLSLHAGKPVPVGPSHPGVDVGAGVGVGVGVGEGVTTGVGVGVGVGQYEEPGQQKQSL